MSAATAETPGALRLIDLLLRDQSDLSAVERFSQHHVDASRPAQERFYSDLIPASSPAPGEQYAFRVDLDACTGCKACVTACHNLNGLDEGETWRDVGLLVGGSDAAPVQQTVTTACHHCEDPACLAGCPVRAYEKDPITGIVRHLDDQCIGCQYCVLKCPYDVPKYDATRGIVRKCDMCSDRLAVGEAPACVQGCPNEAITIDRVAIGAAPGQLLPALPGSVPDSSYTRPTTRYVGERSRRIGLRPAGEGRATPADPHHPLAAMLVLSQLAVGVFVFDALLNLAEVGGSPARIALGALAAALGLAVANLHLGRPQYAFRAVLGLGTSWMSREILVLGAFAGSAIGSAGCAALMLWWPAVGSALPVPLASLQVGLAGAAAGIGLLAVFCSVMIYADTHRAFWRLRRSAPLFFGSTLTLGLAASVVVVLLTHVSAPAWVGGVCLAWALAVAAKLDFETRLTDSDDPAEVPSLDRSRALLSDALRATVRRRRALGWIGGVGIPVLVALVALAFPASAAGALLAVVGFSAFAAGEWLERHLFFRACAPLGMPTS